MNSREQSLETMSFQARVQTLKQDQLGFLGAGSASIERELEAKVPLKMICVGLYSICESSCSAGNPVGKLCLLPPASEYTVRMR